MSRKVPPIDGTGFRDPTPPPPQKKRRPADDPIGYLTDEDREFLKRNGWEDVDDE